MSDSANLTPDNDAAQGVDLLEMAELYAAWAQDAVRTGNYHVAAEWAAIESSLREKAARDAAPADPDLRARMETLAVALSALWADQDAAVGIDDIAPDFHLAAARAYLARTATDAAAIDGRSQAPPADLRALKDGDLVLLEATFDGMEGATADVRVKVCDYAFEFGREARDFAIQVPIAGLHPAVPPAQPASQVTLNCARCVQNGETAANVAGATCGRCGNATPATSPPTPAVSVASWHERVETAVRAYENDLCVTGVRAVVAREKAGVFRAGYLTALAVESALSEGQQR